MAYVMSLHLCVFSESAKNMQRQSGHSNIFPLITLLVTATFFLGGCFTRNDPMQKASTSQPQAADHPQPAWQADRNSIQNNPAQPPRAQSCPTAECAIRMAMKQILLQSGREAINRQLPLEAEIDEKGVWTVRGTLPQYAQGKVNTVRIDSRTAKILSIK